MAEPNGNKPVKKGAYIYDSDEDKPDDPMSNNQYHQPQNQPKPYHPELRNIFVVK